MLFLMEKTIISVGYSISKTKGIEKTMKKKIVITLGHKALGTTLPEQQEAVKHTAKQIAGLVEDGCQIVISHSNAPQVGMIHAAMNEFGAAHPEYTVAPMSVCSAMSQGYIGYDLQNAIRSELLKRGIFRTVSTVLTQVIVDAYDEAFYHPCKTIGRCLSKEEADAEEKKGNYVIEEPGKGYRRIVAAPRPKDIVEIDAIRTLVDANQIVIACGGGGIPVLEQGHRLKGASAVIEKDLAGGKLAELIDADQLIILTGVEKVSLNYGTKEEHPVDKLTVSEAKRYMAHGEFGRHSMLPKIEASVSFIEKGTNRSALITTMEKLYEARNGKNGTLITP